MFQHFGPDELDGGGAGQHAVRGAIHLSHPAAAEQLTQFIAAHFTFLDHLAPQARDHMRDHHRYTKQQVARVVHDQGIL